MLHSYPESFARVEANRKAIDERGWGKNLNRALLKDPKVLTTKTSNTVASAMDTTLLDHTPPIQTQGQEYAQSLVESCNTSSGFSAELFGRLMDSADTERQKAVRQKRKDIGRKLQEVYDGSRKMTSSICFEDCGVLNEDAMNAIMSYNNSKKREREEKDE